MWLTKTRWLNQDTDLYSVWKQNPKSWVVQLLGNLRNKTQGQVGTENWLVVINFNFFCLNKRGTGLVVFIWSRTNSYKTVLLLVEGDYKARNAGEYRKGNPVCLYVMFLDLTLVVHWLIYKVEIKA